MMFIFFLEEIVVTSASEIVNDLRGSQLVPSLRTHLCVIFIHYKKSLFKCSQSHRVYQLHRAEGCL